MNVIFVSDAKGFRINHCGIEPVKLDGKVYNDGDTIVQFDLYRTADAVRGIVEKGQKILDAEKDAERVEFVRKYPANNKAYREVKFLPKETMDNGSIVFGAGTGQQVNVTQVIKNSVEKTIRYKDLERNLYKIDDSNQLVLKAKFDEAELNEYNELKKELNQ